MAAFCVVRMFSHGFFLKARGVGSCSCWEMNYNIYRGRRNIDTAQKFLWRSLISLRGEDVPLVRACLQLQSYQPRLDALYFTENGGAIGIVTLREGTPLGTCQEIARSWHVRVDVQSACNQESELPRLLCWQITESGQTHPYSAITAEEHARVIAELWDEKLHASDQRSSREQWKKRLLAARQLNRILVALGKEIAAHEDPSDAKWWKEHLERYYLAYGGQKFREYVLQKSGKDGCEKQLCDRLEAAFNQIPMVLPEEASRVRPFQSWMFS